MIKAPFTPEQIDALNKYQNSGIFHPYTCGNEKCRQDLIATENGWICPCCEYTQNWAHDILPSKNEIENLTKERDIYWTALKNIISISKLNASLINPDYYKMFQFARDKADQALEEGKKYRPQQPMSEPLLKKLASIHGIDLDKCKGEDIDIITGKPIFPDE